MQLEQRSYPIGAFKCSYADFTTILSQFPPLSKIHEATKIEGPFDGKINSIFLIGWRNASVIFRTRVSKAFRYEPIVKEKILYPLLDQTITKDTPELYQKIKFITNQTQGSYYISRKKPSVVPVQDLLFFYEPTTSCDTGSNPNPMDFYPPKPFPFLLTIKNFLPGKSFFDILKNVPSEEKHSHAIKHIFEMSGRLLSNLHKISFDAFYDKITDIGSLTKPSWIDLFMLQWKKNQEDASQYKAFQPLIPALTKYLKDKSALIDDEKEAVLFHNDYQTQNIILADNPEESFNSTKKYQVKGIIDFDNWRIGPRAQDFVKMEYWSIQNDSTWLDAFYKGYSQNYMVTKELKTRIGIYKVLWFMLVYSFEMDKIRKNEVNATVDARFPAADIYIDQIKAVISEYL